MRYTIVFIRSEERRVGKELIRVAVSLYLYIEYYNKYKNYGIVQSQWTLVVYKNTKGSNHKSHKIKDFKGKETNS